jgi:hypothetical protein
METTRSPRGVPAGDGPGGRTPHSYNQLMNDATDRTPGFRLVTQPDGTSLLCYIVERRGEDGWEYDIFQPGHVESGIPQQKFRTVVKPNSQTVQVPEWLQKAVQAAWQRPDRCPSEVLKRQHNDLGVVSS